MRGGKRPGAGRPKGVTGAYAQLLKIVELVEQELARQLKRNPQRRPNISRACQTIMKRGVARISARDWRVLRSRYVDGRTAFHKHNRYGRVVAVCVFDWSKKSTGEFSPVRKPTATDVSALVSATSLPGRRG